MRGRRRFPPHVRESQHHWLSEEVKDSGLTFAEFALEHIGDAVRPITVRDMSHPCNAEDAVDFLQGRLGKSIDISTAARMRAAETQDELDIYLYEAGALAWEDIGIEDFRDFLRKVESVEMERYLRYELGVTPSRMQTTEVTSNDLEELITVLHHYDMAMEELKTAVLLTGNGDIWPNEPKHLAQPARLPMRGLAPKLGVITASKAEESRPRTNRFNLPAELRNRIFDLALADVRHRQQPLRFTPYTDLSEGVRRASIIKQSREPGLLRVNKQVRAETAPVYYGFQKALVVVPPFVDPYFNANNALYHVSEVLPFMQDVEFYWRFNYEGTRTHGPKNKDRKHEGTATVVLRLKGDRFTTTVYVLDQGMCQLGRGVDCCSREGMPMIEAGTQVLENMLKRGVGDPRHLEKEGETKYLYIGMQSFRHNIASMWKAAAEAKHGGWDTWLGPKLSAEGLSLVDTRKAGPC